jgi:hypothetical protein
VLRPLRLVPWGALAAAGLLAGCFTGPRPELAAAAPAIGGAPGTPTGVAGADVVLSALEAAGTSPFTATYRLTRRLGNRQGTGLVVRDGPRLSVTVGDVRFLSGSAAQTCSLRRRACQPGTNDARISDLSVGSSFWAAGPARALRVALTRRTGTPVASTMSVAGVQAQCIDVAVGAGSEGYCATPSGAVAMWQTAAVTVALTRFAAVADQSAFDT